MSFNQVVLFQPAKHPYHFSAIGYLTGSFQTIEIPEGRNFISGTIFTPEGLELKASVKKKDWERIIKRSDYKENGEFYWLLAFRTTEWGNLSHINLIKPLSNPPLIVDLSGKTNEEKIDLFQVRGRIQRILKTKFWVRLERNKKTTEGKEDGEECSHFLVTIQGNLPSEATPEQFWEILCTRDRDALRLKQATLITEEMVLAWEI